MRSPFFQIKTKKKDFFLWQFDHFRNDRTRLLPVCTPWHPIVSRRERSHCFTVPEEVEEECGREMQRWCYGRFQRSTGVSGWRSTTFNWFYNEEWNKRRGRRRRSLWWIRRGSLRMNEEGNSSELFLSFASHLTKTTTVAIASILPDGIVALWQQCHSPHPYHRINH